MDSSFFDSLAKNLTDAIPGNLKALSADLQKNLEKNFKSILEANLSKLNLVTSEEFNIQASVLLKTREQLEQLATRVSILEEQRRTNIEE